MSLHEIPLELGKFPLSLKADEFLWEAGRRVERFYSAELGQRYPKYIPCDPVLVWEAISYLQSVGSISGEVFCEWGSGFGIASGLASLLGMKAYGIEVEEELVDRSMELMKDSNLSVEILPMSYLPEGFEVAEGKKGKRLVISDEKEKLGDFNSCPEYDGLDPQQVSLFFAYPWPGEELMMVDLFSVIASDDAVLLIYFGDGRISAFRRGGDEKRCNANLSLSFH